MAQNDRNSTWDLVTRWVIRVLAVIGVIDAAAFMSNGDPNPNPILIVLTVIGVIGAIVAWLSTRLPGKEWAWLGLGAFMNAVAPAIFYPANGLLVIAGIAVLIVGVVRLGTTAQTA